MADKIMTTEEIYQLGWDYFEKYDYSKAAKLFQKLSDEGHVGATLILGFMYEDGLGVEKDIRRTIELYQCLADKGNVEAISRLGDIYRLDLNGDGVADIERAIALYQKAADAGDLSAMFSLGIIYSRGDGVPKNEEIAFEWYRKAAEKGYPYAMEVMGIYYEYGDVVEEDLEKAREWYRKAGTENNHFPDPKLALFDKLLMTQDREEYINLAMQLFPEKSREEVEKMADEMNLALSGQIDMRAVEDDEDCVNALIEQFAEGHRNENQ